MKLYYNKKKTREYLEEFNKMQFFSEELINIIKINEYEPNEFIYMTGEEIRDIKFLVDGTLLVTEFGEDGEEAVVCLSTPFNIIGDLEISLETCYVERNVQAKSKCIMLSLNLDILKESMNVNLYKLINSYLAIKLKNIANTIAYNSTQSLEKRYLNLYNSDLIDKQALEYLSQKDIARLLGVSDRQLRRVIKKISEEIAKS